MVQLAKIQPVSLLAQSLEEAFPVVDPNFIPSGQLVLLQMKQPATRTASGLVLTQNDIATEADNTQVGRVIELGPVAYRSRETLMEWPEGEWVKVGDYVRINKYHGDRWTVAIPGTKGYERHERVTFIAIEDLAIKGTIPDPMALQAFF